MVAVSIDDGHGPPPKLTLSSNCIIIMWSAFKIPYNCFQLHERPVLFIVVNNRRNGPKRPLRRMNRLLLVKVSQKSHLMTKL